ncbi:hypothetical protein [Kitasatospora sp. NPDC056731]|uniref:hypothetical protein n=1 Tax=Kitasatospora sp. NPDC056731 TaxID=3155422 RepID=UPI0034484EEA
MKIEYGLDVSLPNLGYGPGHDKIVFNVQSELNMYTTNSKDAMKIWGWDPSALRPEDHYRIDQLLRLYVFQRDQVIAALKRLDVELGTYTGAQQRLKALGLDAGNLGALGLDALDLVADFEQTAEAGSAAPSPESEISKQLKAFKTFLRENTWQDLEKWAKENDLYVERPSDPLAAALMSGFEGQAYEDGFPDAEGVIAFKHPVVARYLGPISSLAMGGRSGEGVYFRLTDSSYPREWIKDGRLYDLVDMALALQAELQLQCLLTDREFTRVIQTRGQEFEYLKAEAARKAAEEQGSSFWSVFGDILGIVSAVAGVLALIPILTPIAGPVAAVTAIAALGAHTVDAAIKGDWDAATIVGLGADALAALPGVGAVAKSLKAGKAIVKTIGTGAKASYKASVGVRRAGLTFLAETGGSGASDATKVFNYLGTKGAKVVGATEKSGKIAGKVLQGSVNLATQVPLVVEMSTGRDMSQAKEGASGAALTANYGQSIGSWGIVGDAAKKTGTVSLATFSKIIGRR